MMFFQGFKWNLYNLKLPEVETNRLGTNHSKFASIVELLKESSKFANTFFSIFNETIASNVFDHL